MGIRFHCPNGHRLNVKAFLAGKRGICPKCGARFTIPLESETNHAGGASAVVAAAPVAASASVDPIADAPDAVWYVRAAAGGEYGPASGEVMRTWLTEGRVTADSWVWRDGWPDWRQAAGLFPQLTPAAPARPPVAPAAPAPPPAVAPAQPVAQWADVAPADVTSNEFTISEEWSDDPTAEGEIAAADPLTATTLRHSSAREKFRQNMLVMTAVLIASALILLGIAVYLVVTRPAATPQNAAEKPASTSPPASDSTPAS